MFIDRRQGPRVAMHYRARVEPAPGQPLRDCVMVDVSSKGARLVFEKPDELPEDFTLVLSDRGTPRRRCHVTWRTEEEVGVNFEDDGLRPLRCA